MGNQKAMEKLAAAMLFGYNGLQNIKGAISLYEILAEKGSHKGQTVSVLQLANQSLFYSKVYKFLKKDYNGGLF